MTIAETKVEQGFAYISFICYQNFLQLLQVLITLFGIFYLEPFLL